jgi:hypothetical protein
VAQRLDARSARLVVHGAGLERGEVLVDRGGLGLDLCLDGVEFAAPVCVAVAVVPLGAGDRVGDQGVGVGVEVEQGLQGCGVGGRGD